ncbi:MAG: YaeQ family protein [Saezia sp.]
MLITRSLAGEISQTQQVAPKNLQSSKVSRQTREVMALKATIYKAIINVADMDRQHYQDQTLTLACHPSETESRLMVRLVAWVLYADESLVFTKGLDDSEEPALWRKDDCGYIKLWVELGLPDERRLKKACSRAEQVILIAYGERPAKVWWGQNQRNLGMLRNLQVLFIDDAALAQLVPLCARAMRLQATIQDGELWLSSDTQQATLNPEAWQRHE